MGHGPGQPAAHSNKRTVGPTDLPVYHFVNKCRDFEVISHLSHLEPTAALLEVIDTNQLLRSCPFFAPRPGRSQSLAEFKDAQVRQMDLTLIELRSWPNKVASMVRSGLRGIKKGWWNVDESRMPSYLSGPLRPLLKLIGFNMQIEFTNMVLRCSRELRTMVVKSAAGHFTIHAINDVEAHFHPNVIAELPPEPTDLSEIEQRPLDEDGMPMAPGADNGKGKGKGNYGRMSSMALDHNAPSGQSGPRLSRV